MGACRCLATSLQLTSHSCLHPCHCACEANPELRFGGGVDYVPFSRLTVPQTLQRVRLWKRCPIIPQPKVWPWWVVILWDFVDWSAFLLWYINATPNYDSDDLNGEFLESDEWFVLSSCAILYWGPVLPLLSFVLPRDPYLFVEIAFDAMQAFFIQWVTSSYNFDARAIWFVYLNWGTTVIDALLLKGPEVLDQMISPWLDRCCIHPEGCADYAHL